MGGNEEKSAAGIKSIVRFPVRRSGDFLLVKIDQFTGKDLI